jgi:hypothetical protein
MTDIQIGDRVLTPAQGWVEVERFTTLDGVPKHYEEHGKKAIEGTSEAGYSAVCAIDHIQDVK